MKQIFYIFLIILTTLYVVGTIYYTLLLYGFSSFGVFVSATLTLIPFVCGIFLKCAIDKIIFIKNKK